MTCRKHQKYLREEVTVCSACLRASCWQAKFFCDDYRSAGTKRLTRQGLFDLATGEHPSYWKTDAQVAAEG